MARSSSQPMTVPLGSLTQAGARTDAACSECGSERVTHLAMTLTDGTPVEFVSCHRCEHKTWVDASGVQHQEMPVTSVLDKTRKPT
ncbi:MAG TPA: hypothetical protein VMX11_09120 [Actinomycetes bacterium]|nr:hypothetical protein [Actinomycetes bacterium]